LAALTAFLQPLFATAAMGVADYRNNICSFATTVMEFSNYRSSVGIFAIAAQVSANYRSDSYAFAPAGRELQTTVLLQRTPRRKQPDARPRSVGH